MIVVWPRRSSSSTALRAVVSEQPQAAAMVCILGQQASLLPARERREPYTASSRQLRPYEEADVAGFELGLV